MEYNKQMIGFKVGDREFIYDLPFLRYISEYNPDIIVIAFYKSNGQRYSHILHLFDDDKFKYDIRLLYSILGDINPQMCIQRPEHKFFSFEINLISYDDIRELEIVIE